VLLRLLLNDRSAPIAKDKCPELQNHSNQRTTKERKNPHVSEVEVVQSKYKQTATKVLFGEKLKEALFAESGDQAKIN